MPNPTFKPSDDTEQGHQDYENWLNELTRYQETETHLVQTIKVLVEKGEKAKQKAKDFFIAAGQHLKKLKEIHEGRGGTWASWEILVKEKCGIGKWRASELMQIADGRKTVESSRAANAEANKRLRDRRPSPSRDGETRALAAPPAAEGSAAANHEPDDVKAIALREYADQIRAAVAAILRDLPMPALLAGLELRLAANEKAFEALAALKSAIATDLHVDDCDDLLVQAIRERTARERVVADEEAFENAVKAEVAARHFDTLVAEVGEERAEHILTMALSYIKKVGLQAEIDTLKSKITELEAARASPEQRTALLESLDPSEIIKIMPSALRQELESLALRPLPFQRLVKEAGLKLPDCKPKTRGRFRDLESTMQREGLWTENANTTTKSAAADDTASTTKPLGQPAGQEPAAADTPKVTTNTTVH